MDKDIVDILDLKGICVFDDVHDRILNGYHEADDEMTIEKCLSICRSREFQYSGVQWQIECYCGNEPEGTGFKWAWPSKCNDRCAGDSNQICGGTNAMSVYTTPPKDPQGICIYDYPHRRVLDDYSITGHKNMSVINCKNICSGLGSHKYNLLYLNESETACDFILIK